jgi:nucleoid-associated protein YgaU
MPTQITLVGGDLYRLAARTYGDATQWYRIAAANGLHDPIVPGPATLIVPDPTAQPTNGGVLGGTS